MTKEGADRHNLANSRRRFHVQTRPAYACLDLRVAPGGAPSGSLKVKFPSARTVPIKPSAELVATMKQVLKMRDALSTEAWSGMRLILSQDGRCDVGFDYGVAAPVAHQAASS
jgi:hypothetical protein